MKKKVAILTGGTSGIGLALAARLVDAGYRVIITQRSTSSTLTGVEVVQLDLAQADSVEQAAKHIAVLTPEIDLLINNAGVADDIGLVIPTLQSLQPTIAVNLTGTVLFTERLLPLLSGGGLVVNVSSAMGLLSAAGENAPAYRISKAGLNMYTKILAKRYEATKVSVIAIHPGWVRTRLGGPDAPVDANWSAEQIFRSISLGPFSGTFIDVQRQEVLAL